MKERRKEKEKERERKRKREKESERGRKRKRGRERAQKIINEIACNKERHQKISVNPQIYRIC